MPIRGEVIGAPDRFVAASAEFVDSTAAVRGDGDTDVSRVGWPDAFWASRHWIIHALRPGERGTRRRDGRERERDGREKNARRGWYSAWRPPSTRTFTDGAAMVHFARVAVG